MARNKPLDTKAILKVNKRVIRYVKRILPKKMFKEFKDNTPISSPVIGQNVPGNAKRNTKLQISSNKFTITGDYKYSGILDYGGFPNPPKKGTGKTTGGYSTQATKGMSEPTLIYGNKILAEYIRRVNR